MSRFVGLDSTIHEKVKNTQSQTTDKKKTAILLTNLGSPDAPSASAVRRYLSEFLSDPRVVEIPRLIWLIILHGIILRVRPAKSAKLYQSIWTDQGAPLISISKQQQQALQQHCDEQQLNCDIYLAMRYANPSINAELKRIQQQGYSKIVVLPLYPQYAGPTTGSTFDAIYKQVKQWRWIPSIHFISGYYDHELYIQALANSVKQDFAKHGKPEKLILSYHGMPKRFLEQGDPYFCMCQKTSRLLAQRLQLSDSEFITTFQSRFGKAEWLKPYTDKTLEELAGCGIKNIAIMSPAFSADCLETIEELEEENKEIFIDAGGEQYRYIKALNHDADHIQMMAALIKPYL